MTEWPTGSNVLTRLRLVSESDVPGPKTKVRRRHDSYLATYAAYLSYFQDRTTLSTDDLLVGAGMVYSWMPSALMIEPKLLETCLPFVQAANSRKLGQKELEILRAAMGNSMVGASKLLHFVAPNKYPIWDSRICRFLLEATHQRLIQDAKGYVRYQQFCDELINSRGFGALQKTAISISGYQVVPMRAVELLMFIAGASGKRKPSAAA